MGLPFSITLEIMTIGTVVFLIAIPWALQMWSDFHITEAEWTKVEEYQFDPVFEKLCGSTEELHRECISDYEFKRIMPFVTTLLLGLVVIIVSYIQDTCQRRAFIAQKIIAVQQAKIIRCTRKGARLLQMQKENQEKLIYSMFPREVAKDLIERNDVHKKASLSHDAGTAQNSLRTYIIW